MRFVPTVHPQDIFVFLISAEHPSAKFASLPFDIMGRFNNKNKFWQRYSGQALFRLIIAVSAFAISYEGMSQGIMGAVTIAPEFMVGGRRPLTKHC
jgi:hypothetical protein